MSRVAYAASKKDFIYDLDTNVFMTKMCEGAALNRIGGSYSEKKSWEANANKMRGLLSLANLPDDVQIAFEYKSPLAGRVDCMLFGVGNDNKKHVIHIELKQWSNDSVKQLFDTGVFEVTAFVGGQYQVLAHPSQQALNYHQNIINYIPVISEEKTELEGFAYCYNYTYEGRPNDLFAEQYIPVMKKCPLSGGDQVLSFADSLRDLLSSGKGEEVFREFISSPIRPSKNLMDAAANMLNGKEEFILIEDQLTSSNVIFGMVEKAIKKPFSKMALIVKGGPGTGKTVIALHVIAELAAKYSKLNAFFTTRSTALRDTLRSKLRDISTASGADASGLIRSIYDFKPCNFKEGEVDVLLIDEAHRITNSSNFMGDKKNAQTYLSMVLSLLYCAKICVFFIDDHQGVKKEEIGLSSKIIEAAKNYSAQISTETEQFIYRVETYKRKLKEKEQQISDLCQRSKEIPLEDYTKKYNRLKAGIDKLREEIFKEYQLDDIKSEIRKIDVMTLELKSQFRCNGSDNYLDWIDAVLYNDKRTIKAVGSNFRNEYMFDICDSPEVLEETIRSLDNPQGTPVQVARIVAGYCWDWTKYPLSNGDLAKDVKIGNWAMPWETNQGRARGEFSKLYAPSAELWASHPMGINQVGCIFSAQGFEVDYIGVILGPDIRYDKEQDRIVTVKGVTHSVKGSDEEVDTCIRNIYRVLLSRGRRGCYIYCCDNQLADYFKSIIE